MKQDGKCCQPKDVFREENLVFFKIVKSKIKFEQMIGRGTRLCPGIFGPGKDKEGFYIFDWCGNFDYFSQHPEGINPSNAKSLTERLFSLRLDIANVLQSAEHQEIAFDKQLYDDLKHLLHSQVNNIGKGTKEEYDELVKDQPYKNNVAAFIRVIHGIDRRKALQIYQQFIDGYDLTSEQERYLKNILDYVSVNGDIETRNFMEYPLKSLNWQATFGDHFMNLRDFVVQIHQVISTTA